MGKQRQVESRRLLRVELLKIEKEGKEEVETVVASQGLKAEAFVLDLDR